MFFKKRAAAEAGGIPPGPNSQAAAGGQPGSAAEASMPLSAPPAAASLSQAAPPVAPAPAAPTASATSPIPAAPTSPAAPLPPDELRRRAAASKAMAANLGEIVAVMMRVAPYRHMALADLEWMVMPALACGQFSVAEARSPASGFAAPVAVVLWARVSAEISERLAGETTSTINLKPHEWRSGDHVWVVDAIGEPRIIAAMMQRLRRGDWAGKPVRLRTRTADGRTVVRTLAPMARATPEATVPAATGLGEPPVKPPAVTPPAVTPPA